MNLYNFVCTNPVAQFVLPIIPQRRFLKQMKRILLSFLVAVVLGLGAVTVAYAQDQTEDKPMMATKKKAKSGGKKAMNKGGRMMAPKGPADCVNMLITWAEKDPLIADEGKPEDTVNNKLLWSDAKSKCYVGTDQEVHKKLLELANAWRMKDAATVRSKLQELKSALPQT